jgi:hypothetical protein
MSRDKYWRNVHRAHAQCVILKGGGTPKQRARWGGVTSEVERIQFLKGRGFEIEERGIGG